jgi:hypothetical protein
VPKAGRKVSLAAALRTPSAVNDLLFAEKSSPPGNQRRVGFRFRDLSGLKACFVPT